MVWGLARCQNCTSLGGLGDPKHNTPIKGGCGLINSASNVSISLCLCIHINDILSSFILGAAPGYPACLVATDGHTDKGGHLVDFLWQECVGVHLCACEGGS